jgi:uncharacterized protein
LVEHIIRNDGVTCSSHVSGTNPAILPPSPAAKSGVLNQFNQAGDVLMRAAVSLAVCLALIGVARAETIEISGPQGALEAEYLSVPNASDVLVLIPGSGPTDRNGNSPQGLQTNTYKLIAEELQKLGIASIRIDKRGMFGSAKAIVDPNAVTIEDYASDAKIWITKTKDYAPCVWLAGHSEGGLVALVASQGSADICGVVLLAAPGRPLAAIMREQLRANPANAPILDEAEAIITDLEAGKPRDEASISAPLQPLFNASIQPFLINLFSYDPAKLAETLAKPTLILDGDADIQVSLKDGDALKAAAPNAQRITLKGATHVLKQDVPGDPYATYTKPELPLHAELIPAIMNFIKKPK